jgi:ribosome biogenesis GTPase
VQAALADGSLDAERFQSYQKLQRELHYLEIRHDARARSEARKRWRSINKEARARARP